MALIQWNDSLSVDIVEIDIQHQKLVGMINDLNEAMRQGKGKDILGKILNGLAAYAAVHFATEENYFSQFAYPETVSHKKEHADFVARISEFKEGLAQGRIALSVEIMIFLSDWLRSHIKVVDKKYAPFFKHKGLK